MRNAKVVHMVLIAIIATVLLAIACAPKPTPAPPPATPAPTPVAATSAPPAPVPTPQVVATTPLPTTPVPTPAVKLPAVMSVATAGVGTTSYIVASSFAEVISKYTGTKLSVEPSGAVARWIPLMKTKEIDLGIYCSTSDVKDAYYGQYFWKGQGPQPILQLAIGQVQPWGFVVTDPKIKSIADLKGKKVYGNIKTMRSYSQVPMVLRESGLKPGDVESLTFADVNEATKGIQEGKAIGLWYIPTVLPIVELDRSKPLYGVPVPKEVADKINEEFPEQGFMIWKKGDGIGKEDIPFLALPCAMAARADLDPEVIYTLLKTIYAHYDEYKDKHPIMKWWTPEQAVSVIGSPVHPGAVKYFKEVGVWKEKEEKLQQKLLTQPRG